MRRQADLGAVSDDLIKDHIGLVRHVANKYSRISTGCEYDDLVSAGLVGLANAALRFDASKEYKFVTYAHAMIRGSIRKYLRGKTRLIHIPLWVSDRASKPQVTASLDQMEWDAPGEECESEAAISRLDLQQALSRLPKRQRRVIVLRYMDGLDWSEVALRMGFKCSQRAHYHANAGLQTLRRMLGEDYAGN